MALRARPGVGQPKDYTAEFRELGEDAVRKELLQRRWRPEKLAAARIWVESRDTHSWAAARADRPPMDRKKKWGGWALYLGIAFGVIYAGVRIFRLLMRVAG